MSTEEKLKELAELYEQEDHSEVKSINELVKGTLAENMQELRLLLTDFHSSCTPDPNDPKTQEALDCVAVNIYNGLYSEQDFYDFAEFSLGNGYFAEACKKYVSDLLKSNSVNGKRME